MSNQPRPTKDDILLEIKEKDRFYTQGKSPKGIDAAIDYITNNETQVETAERHGVTSATLRKRTHEIMKLLGIKHPYFKKKYPVKRTRNCVKCGSEMEYPRYTIHYYEEYSRSDTWGTVVGYICPVCFEILREES